MCNEPEHCETVKALAEENRRLREQHQTNLNYIGILETRGLGEETRLEADLRERLSEAEKIMDYRFGKTWRDPGFAPNGSFDALQELAKSLRGSEEETKK